MCNAAQSVFVARPAPREVANIGHAGSRRAAEDRQGVQRLAAGVHGVLRVGQVRRVRGGEERRGAGK